MSKNVAVFVDVANIFYAAKAAGVDIDYVTLLQAATAGRDFVRAYAYTGLDPENENQRQFHSFLGRSGYKVVSKDIRKYGDGRIKANLDIELVVDMMKLSRNLDVAVVISGDGDFAPAIRAVQEMGVRVEVVSFRGNTSSDLIDAADVFTDISAIARVDKDSVRSGRRVAAEGDLSMTEVPNKETEGAARRRRGARGEYGRDRADGRSRGGESRDRDRDRIAAVEVTPSSGVTESAGLPGNLIVLPGEKLSRAPLAATGAATDTGMDGIDVMAEEASEELDEQALGGGASVTEVATSDGIGDESGDGRRRRRRRGGRGRGRGRGTEGESVVEAAGPAELGTVPAVALEEEDLEEPEAIRLPSHSTFGSVWDSQIGVPSQSMLPVAELGEEEYEDEPEIPEYLLAERQQRARGPNRMGGRMGARNAGYQAAVDRERYGRSAPPSGGPTFAAPRRDDRSGRPAGAGAAGARQERQGGRGQGAGRGPGASGGAVRPARPERSGMRDERSAPRADRIPTSAGGPLDPWSEVPPELEQMLRAELARKVGPAGGGGRSERGRSSDATDALARAAADEAADADELAADEAMAAHDAAMAEAAMAEEAISATSSPSEPPATGRRRTARGRAGTAGTRAGGAPSESAASPEASTADTPPESAAAIAEPIPGAIEPAAGATRRRSARLKAAPQAPEPVLAGPEDAVTTAATGRTVGLEPGAGPTAEAASAVPEAPKPRGRRTARSQTADAPTGTAAPAPEALAAVEAEPAAAEAPAPKRRTTRRAAPKPADTAGADAGSVTSAGPGDEASADAPGERAGAVSRPGAGAVPGLGAKPSRRTRGTSPTASSEG